MKLSSWLNSLTSAIPASRPRPRKNSQRRMPTEVLECRALLSGDTLATATVVDLNDDQPDEFTDEIGNEGHGNLDVDLYEVTLTAGGTFVVNGNEVSPRDQIQKVADQLAALSQQHDSAHIAAARDEAQAAVDALDHSGSPLVGVAFDRLRDAVKEIDDAIDDHHLGTDVGNGLANMLAGAARNMAQNVHDYAGTVGGTASKLEESQNKLNQADDKRAVLDFSGAINKYKSAGIKAHQAAHDVGQEDSSQALNSLIVTIRLFDSSGNELAEVHGQGGITLTYDVTDTGTYYVGISGNDNFEYNPSEEESGAEGSTGCYEMEMCMDMPPVITLLEAVLVDPVNGTWHISGTVEDEDPESCVINFGGILTGHSTNVEADGTFFFSIDLDKYEPNGEGPACAVAVDSMGQESDPWEFEITQDC